MQIFTIKQNDEPGQLPPQPPISPLPIIPPHTPPPITVMAATKVMTIPEIPKREGLDLDWNMDLDALDLHIPHPAIKVSE